jgi:outer membrane receptor protein involved in Fe transport
MDQAGRSTTPTALSLLALLAALATPTAPRAEEPPATPAAPPPTTAEPAPAQAAPPGDKPAEPLGEELVVTATRSPRPLRDVPATVVVLPRAEIEQSPMKTSDELLGTVPSFDLFRRSSSLASDPSAQGVKLRGVGGTAVARALVLLDGVPVNDPYAGWVAWRAFPALGLERIEVVPGGGAALYGNYALGGVIQLFSRPITPRTAAAEVEAGSFGTDRFEAHASDVLGPVGLALDTELLGTSGYHVVAPYDRGPVDQATPGEHAVVNARLEAQATRDLALTLRAGYFFQDSVLGTTFTTASVHRLELSGGATWTAGEAGRLALTLFGHHGDFKQGRARIGPGRATEVSAGHQDVPADDVGASLVWQEAPLRLGGRHTLSAGLDARWISGTTDEHLEPAVLTPASVVRRVANGEQVLYGVFAQDVYEVSEAVEATLAVRYDHWTNAAADRTVTQNNGTVTSTPFPDRSDSQVDPKLGLRVRIQDWLTARASVYAAFRAPTLDELYRPFQVQTTYTLANENLRAETLRGGEVGLEVAPGPDLLLRVTGFWNELEDPVNNVTIPLASCPPGITICRQRQNLGKARIPGVEASADWRLAPRWVAGATYAFMDGTVTSAPGNEALVGKRLAQSPLYRATVSLTYEPRPFALGAQVRLLGQQYEDDLNTLPLHEAAVVDLFGTWHASRAVDVFVAVNNLLDKTYLVGRAGVDTVGQPLFVHGGLRFQPGRSPRSMADAPDPHRARGPQEPRNP